MNTSLALFFCDDYMVAAVQPFEGKYTVIASTDDKKFSFYFYTNPHTADIDFGSDYKKLYLKKSPLYFGDLVNNIGSGATFELGGTQQSYLLFFDNIIKVVRELYASELGKYDSNFAVSDSTVIDAVAMFVDNIPADTQAKISRYFESKKIRIVRTESVDAVAVSYCASKNGKFCQNRKFAVLEALGGNLNMSIVNADQKTFARAEFKPFKGYGVDPMVKVIAEQIVNHANRHEHIIDADNKAEINSEIVRHYSLADQVIDFFNKNTEKQSIKLNTVFACNPTQRIPVTLSLEELNKTAYLYSRQYSGFFDNWLLQEVRCSQQDLENILLVGKSLGNNSLLQEFRRYGDAKILHYGDSDVQEFLIELFKQPLSGSSSQPDGADEAIDEESTMFLAGNEPSGPARKTEAPVQKPPVMPSKPVTNEYAEVPSLSVVSLRPGTKVWLNTYDSTPGKGKAHQELEYQGGGKFVILSSSRSLHFGDIAEPVSMVWNPGVQLDFMVVRGGHDLGRFRTRVVTSILVK